MDITQTLQTVLDCMHEQVYVRDLDMNILYINPAAEKLTGWILKEALGKKCYEVFGDKHLSCRDVCPVETAISQKRFVQHHEGELKTRAGDIRKMKVSISPFQQSDEVAGAVVTMQDISGLKELEDTHIKTLIKLEKEVEDRKKSEERFRVLFEQANDAIYVHDLKGCFHIVNSKACDNLGYTEKELLNMKVADVDPDFIAREDEMKFWPSLPVTFEGQHRRKDGSMFPVEVRLSMIVFREQRLVLALVSDITERKRLETQRLSLEQQRQQIEKAESLSRMAGAIAHNFNNILGAVLGNLEIAMEDLPLGIDITGNLVRAIGAAQRAAETSGHMLTFLGQKHETPFFIDLSKTCHEILTQLHPPIPEGVNLETDLPIPGPVIMADPAQIGQVLNALIINA